MMKIVISEDTKKIRIFKNNKSLGVFLIVTFLRKEV